MGAKWENKNMIPKKIHYCWFGNKEKSKFAKKCIATWKKYLTGYEFCEWNEENFDINSAPEFVQQAYAMKKYAFVSDYVRLHALYNYGGVYMDTDVEVLRDFPNEFFEHSVVLGLELDDTVMTGVIISEKHNELIGEFLEYYQSTSFVDENNKMNTVANTTILTRILKERNIGLKATDEVQILDNDIIIYPIDWLCGYDLRNNRPHTSVSTITIHHYASSWLPLKAVIALKCKKMLNNIVGYDNYDKIKKIIKR